MSSFSPYDRVIHEIYEAALVPARWDVAMTTLIGEFAPRDWEVAFLVWEQLDRPAGRFVGQAGLVPIVESVYKRMFSGRNEWAIRGHDMALGQVAHSDELIAREEFVATPFYRLFLSHFGYSVCLMGMLHKQVGTHLGIICPGPPDQDVSGLRTAITRLLPHFQRATRISRRIGEADMRASNAALLLDSSPYAVFALGPDLTLLHANAAAEQALENHSGMARLGNRLNLSDPATQAMVRNMSNGQSEERTHMFTVTDAMGHAFIMNALVVDQAQSLGFSNPAGGATLMLIGGQRLGVSGEMVDHLQAAFGFTLAEARLAGHVIEGSGVEGYAEARGVSLNAARYLMRGLYDKTGLNNQTALTAHLREAPLGWDRPAGKKVRRIV